MFQYLVLAHIALAMVLGGIVGFERELADKPAGLRTHMIVAGASALFVDLSQILVVHYADAGPLISADPIRIVEAIITGVSFLGAGTILRDRTDGRIEGLTTAASLLFVAALGACVALSQFILAAGATIFVVAILGLVKKIEQWSEGRWYGREEDDTEEKTR
jgi:putative Mg2+ transporter-C (MgtC) family protein